MKLLCRLSSELCEDMCRIHRTRNLNL